MQENDKVLVFENRPICTVLDVESICRFDVHVTFAAKIPYFGLS